MRTLTRSQFDIFLCLFTVIAIVTVDQLSKSIIGKFLSLGESLPVIANIFHLTLVYNTGIAFGFFKDQGLVFIIIPIIVFLLLIYIFKYYHDNVEDLDHYFVVAISLIQGGAIGNLIDRLVYGHVIDFLDFRIWPVFNIADSAITIGGLIIVIQCFRQPQKT